MNIIQLNKILYICPKGEVIASLNHKEREKGFKIQREKNGPLESPSSESRERNRVQTQEERRGGFVRLYIYTKADTEKKKD